MNDLLLVTADREFRRFVKESLGGLPVRVLEDCGTAQRAMELFRDARPKLMLVDLFLPESSGIDVIKAIKKLDDHVTTILAARMRTRTLKERAFRIGADDVIMYPFSAATLQDTILHRLDNLKEAEVHFT